MNEPFKPLEYLKRNKPAAQQKNLIINIGKVVEKEPEPKEGEEEFITEETEKADKAEKAVQKKEANKTIKDYRKISKIDRSVIFDRLKDKRPFRVGVLHSLKELSKEPEIPIPIGEPGIKGTKKSVIIKEQQHLEMKTVNEPQIEIPEKSKIISEDVLEQGEPEAEAEKEPETETEAEAEAEKGDLEELEEMVEKAEKTEKAEKEVEEKPTEPKKVTEEVTEEVTKIKKTRKPRLKIVEKDKDINLDLTTTEIQAKLPEIPAPKLLEKITMKAPSYYMNNRKLYVQKIADLLKSYKKDLTDDDKNISCETRTADKEFELLTHQNVMLDYLNLYTPYRGLLVYHGLGSGKCHKKGTLIMLTDGSLKKVEDIKVGEQLMGDDSTPRTVTSLANGIDKMYDVIPVKGEKYTVNSEHILCLRASGFPKISHNNREANTSYNIQWIENNKFQSKTFTYNTSNKLDMEIDAKKFYQDILNNKNTSDNVIEIAIKDYLNISNKKKGFLKGYRVGVEFPEKELPFDPYMIGYWLGDGTSSRSEITCQDSTVLYYFAKNLQKYNLSLNYRSGYTYGISGDGKRNHNILLNTLNELNMLNNKHIPMIYKCNSREKRLKLLAGLIDSDGHLDKNKGFEFTQKNETLMDDVIYLVRSLGFACYKKEKNTTWTNNGIKYEGKAWRICISGKGIEEIPTRIPRKQAVARKQIKDVLSTGITVEYVNEDEYYGFTLDGNCRYIMGDFTVTHNTCSSIAIAEGMKSNKQIFVLTPASLKMNFFTELKKCGDPIYKQNQKWEYISTEGNSQTRTMLTKALSLSTDYFNKHTGAWVVNMETGTNFADKTPEEQKEIDNQLNEMIRTKYKDINYNGLNAKGLVTLSSNYTRNPFDNSVIIIDEAHNFISRIVNKMKKPNSVSYRLYQYLMSAVNAKVVLLTGTPIINYPNEIAILFNILRGYIKTWTLNINVKTSEKITTETILNIFDKENFRAYDYVEYSGNKLTITRNPFGFINVKKRGAVKGTERKPKNTGGTLTEVFNRFLNGGKTRKSKNEDNEENQNNENKEKKSNKRTTKKKKITISSYDNVAPKLEYEELDITEDESAEKAYRIGYNGDFNPHKGGAADTFDKYNGVKLDDAGNIPDNVFEELLVKILNKHGMEIVGKISVTNHKSLPDDRDEFLGLFLKDGEVTNLELFQKRILGLTSYFRSAQEQLLPTFEKTDKGDIFHIVKCEMTPHQFSVYEQIRKIEAEEEKRNRNKKNKAAKMPESEDIYKISSTYRIFSRSACNFAFPNNIRRPVPDKKEISESDFNAVPINIRKEENDEEFEEEVNEKETEVDDDKTNETENEKEKEILTYQGRIEKALDELKFNPETPREEEYLRKKDLEMYSPKFVEILNNLQDEENKGLHLIYSQFRTIEGIGILKLILEANGYAEFKIQKTSGDWEIVENERDNGKPKFVLYTGTETAEEKEIIRNIYNSSWNAIPSNIATKLQGQFENNFLGEVIKIFMITSSGAEGINLKNTRYVHIVEPYWHMVRIEQVIGRARRICSHQDLPEELRTVKVFLYLSILSEEQKKSEKNIELRIRDVSRIDGETPVTTDESLFETATLKDNNNKLFLKAVKETSIDCSLYATGNKEEKLVCYGFGKVESNNFASYPSYERDASEKQDLNIRATVIKAKKITFNGKDYALNTANNEIYTIENYNDHKVTGAELVKVGNLVKKDDGFVVKLI